MLLELTDLMLSDLFFNHEKPNLDAAYLSKSKDKTVEIQDALEKDAIAFCDLVGGQVAPSTLVGMYNNRV